MKKLLYSVFILLMAHTVQGESVVFTSLEYKRILSLSPLPPLAKDPSNQFVDNVHAAKFGRELFFDTRLSKNGDMSCASCHKPEHGWTDGKRVATDKILFPRNVPSLWNTAYNRWFYWDGRADSAWAQALGPIENNNEMAFNRMQLVHLLRRQPDLKRKYEKIFGQLNSQFNNKRRFPSAARPDFNDHQEPLNVRWMAMTELDRKQVNIVFANIGKAIAAFERTLITQESKFDRYVKSLLEKKHKNRNEAEQVHLSRAQQRGLKIFVGQGKCSFCHSGPNFTDGEFHDLGIAVGQNMRVDPGRYLAIKTLRNDPFNRIGQYADVIDPLAPVRFITLQGQQQAQFKTPTLRELTHTGPYMHDGRFKTLREVVEFYSTRKNAQVLEHSSNLLQALNLSEREISDVVSFLESLSTE